MASMDHRNIVRVWDAGRVEEEEALGSRARFAPFSTVPWTTPETHTVAEAPLSRSVLAVSTTSSPAAHDLGCLRLGRAGQPHRGPQPHGRLP